ncbi:MAG TPA: hypothetical protein VNL91_02185, partial [Thermoanaerobaculia bacterium]|nr:hypothetical protein [Thermoanaerobaculia bacterium]
RLAFVGRLFGPEITPHWAPKDARDVIVTPKPEVDDDPERVLRETGGRFDDDQKRRALYVLLGRIQPTEEQKLWLGSVVDSLLR